MIKTQTVHLVVSSFVALVVLIGFAPAEGGELSLAGDWSYTTDYATSMTTLVGGEIINSSSSGKSGELLLSIILTGKPFTGQASDAHVMASVPFDPLRGGYSYTKIKKAGRYVAPAQGGTYHVTIILAEKKGDEYSIVDYRRFVETISYRPIDPQMMMMMMMMSQNTPLMDFAPRPTPGQAYLCQKCRENVANACAHAQNSRMLGTTQASFAAICAKGCADVCR